MQWASPSPARTRSTPLGFWPRAANAAGGAYSGPPLAPANGPRTARSRTGSSHRRAYAAPSRSPFLSGPSRVKGEPRRSKVVLGQVRQSRTNDICEGRGPMSDNWAISQCRLRPNSSGCSTTATSCLPRKARTRAFSSCHGGVDRGIALLRTYRTGAGAFSIGVKTLPCALRRLIENSYRFIAGLPLDVPGKC